MSVEQKLHTELRSSLGQLQPDQDLAPVLSTQPGHGATRPRPVSIDGNRGLYLNTTAPANFNRCPHGQRYGELTMWHVDDGQTWFGETAGQQADLWVLDVRGNRYVIAAVHGAHTPPAQVKQLDRMATSVTFVDEPAS